MTQCDRDDLLWPAAAGAVAPEGLSSPAGRQHRGLLTPHMQSAHLSAPEAAAAAVR